MEKQYRCLQFREYLIASLFAISAQFRAMKWRGSNHCAQRNSDWIGFMDFIHKKLIETPFILSKRDGH